MLRSAPAVLRFVGTTALLAMLAACAGGVPGGGTDVATEAEWRQLGQPRPEALADAPRITVSDIELAGAFPWPDDAGVGPELGMAELVVANLLRRRDVRFVERRRFAEAAAAERRGERAPPGRPPVGVSQAVDLALSATWIPTTPDEAFLEIRLTRLETGDVDGTTRVVLRGDADPVAVARSVVDGALDVLAELDRLPAEEVGPATDPDATNEASASRVSTEGLWHFLRGLAAEEAWRWEAARRGYLRALAADPAFHEARTALARTARLRLGGTLAESQ